MKFQPKTLFRKRHGRETCSVVTAQESQQVMKMKRFEETVVVCCEVASMQAIDILTSCITSSEVMKQFKFRNAGTMLMSRLPFPLSLNDKIRLSLYLIKHHNVGAHGGRKV